MARFYMSASNSRGRETTAMGRADGQHAHIRGWTSGVRVVARPEGDIDCFDVYATSGSGGGASDLLLGTLKGGQWVAACTECGSRDHLWCVESDPR